jgi:adenine-specific DNA methylase
MTIPPKLSVAPLAYSLAKVDGTADHYGAFSKVLWSDEQSVSAAMKELVFLRSSIVNECPT